MGEFAYQNMLASADYWPVVMFENERQYRTGRPTVMTKQVVAKLRHAFLIGCSEREACIFAGIHRSTLYRFEEKYPEFCNQKEAWQTYLVLCARFVIAEAIRGGDVHTSWRYLRAKHPEEFGA